MYKNLIVLASLLALSLAQPTNTQPEAEKTLDKRSIGDYHYHTEAEVGYQHVPVVHNVNVPVTRQVSVPVTSSVSVPVVHNVAVPVVNYRPKVHYHAPSYYSYGYPSYGYGDGYSSWGSAYDYDY